MSTGKIAEVETVARELYGAPLDAFTSSRNEHVKQLKAAGDADAARRVQALKKPTLAAWLVNQLVRSEPEQVGLLLDLGREMRAGLSGLSGDDLRLLTKRRYQLVSVLVNAALGLAGARRPGGDVAADVQATLEATLSDPESADAVETGCLSGPLHVSGFGLVGSPDVVPEDEPGPDADVVDIAAHRERRAQALEAARERVAAAQQAADEADAHRDQVEAALAAAERAEREAAAEVRRLETALDRATSALGKRSNVAAEARDELEEAEDEAEEAHDELAEARHAEQRLER